MVPAKFARTAYSAFSVDQLTFMAVFDGRTQCSSRHSLRMDTALWATAWNKTLVRTCFRTVWRRKMVLPA